MNLSPSTQWYRNRRHFLAQAALSCTGLAIASRVTTGVSDAAWKAPMLSAVSARIAVAEWLGTLSSEQKSIAQMSFDDKRRVEWHFIPMETRKGLPLREMNDKQSQAAIAILSSLLSEAGFRRAVDVMEYEAILLELEGPNAAKRRDYRKFYFAVYGNPEPSANWGFSVEGHHLSLNFTFEGDRIVDSTPQFFGVNPAQLKRDFQTPSILAANEKSKYVKGNRLLMPEEQAAFDLMQSLSEKDRNRVIYSNDCPDDIQWAGEPQPKKSTYVGIPIAELAEEQRKIVKRIVDSYFATMPGDVATERWQILKQTGMEKVHFGWAGGTKPGEQHFFRLQGPTFIAELCNFQTDPEGTIANHIHSIWRDMTGDFNLTIPT